MLICTVWENVKWRPVGASQDIVVSTASLMIRIVDTFSAFHDTDGLTRDRMYDSHYACGKAGTLVISNGYSTQDISKTVLKAWKNRLWLWKSVPSSAGCQKMEGVWRELYNHPIVCHRTPAEHVASSPRPASIGLASESVNPMAFSSFHAEMHAPRGEGRPQPRVLPSLLAHDGPSLRNTYD